MSLVEIVNKSLSSIMTRRLVLTNEAARHPFRVTLPPPIVARAHASDDNDWKLFALSFAAFFTCFYTFIC
ncbi:hypothetical protein EAH84_09950 [Sphingomonas oligophenolica]|uniref:Uncharacterized protein n=2 Tax=Sphingomonas oligophenolica TaxID=301154 RepID=A0A502CHJ7_9SPHN|nr:hypothetical protein EAH84_09950 [Sphingomonas oligophenolica]